VGLKTEIEAPVATNTRRLPPPVLYRAMKERLWDDFLEYLAGFLGAGFGRVDYGLADVN
jgi:hypothetical protein